MMKNSKRDVFKSIKDLANLVRNWGNLEKLARKK